MATSRCREPVLSFCGPEKSDKQALANALARTRPLVANETGPDRRHQTNALTSVAISCLDSPRDYDETGRRNFLASLRQVLPQTDLLVWVIPFEYASLANEIDLAHEALKEGTQTPLVILTNDLDCILENFDPAIFDPLAGESMAEKRAAAWLKLLADSFSWIKPSAIMPCAHGAVSYNLEKVSTCLGEILPRNLRLSWIASERCQHDRRAKGNRLVLAASATAGGIGAMPLPIADMPFIIATQTALILALSSLHGRPLDKKTAKTMALAGLSAVAGPMLMQSLGKIMPFIGHALGAGVAAACTFAVGKVTQRIMESEGELDMKQFKQSVLDIYRRQRKSG